MLEVSFYCYRLHNSDASAVQYFIFPLSYIAVYHSFIFLYSQKNLKQLWQQQQLTRQRWIFAPSMLGMWVFLHFLPHVLVLFKHVLSTWQISCSSLAMILSIQWTPIVVELWCLPMLFSCCNCFFLWLGFVASHLICFGSNCPLKCIKMTTCSS